MVKKIRAQLKANKEKEAERKEDKKYQQTKKKKVSVSNSNSRQCEPARSPLLPSKTNVSLTPVKIDFKKSKRQPDSNDSVKHIITNKVPNPIDMQKVKILMSSLARIEKNFRTGEVELEQLKDDLTRNGHSQLADDTAGIENALSHLQEENRVMYREEVIWII
mmetsp:Transcript_1099/g.1284  ORF Transcript_1099/g.1284 Transcript_1099/m.1284 type:complete len:163 (-) Transcript_1099:134-622(-)